MNSSEASSSMPRSNQVFLSFHGEDTRCNFTDHLYTKLVDTGYQVFRDEEGIPKGQMIRSTLEVAINESKISIVVLSKNYASSRWCLDELVMIMNRHEQEQYTVIPVFYYVDPSDVRHQGGSFAEDFARHKELEEKKRVEGWIAAFRKVGEISGEHLDVTQKRHEAKVIEKIVEDVGRISGLKKGSQYEFHVPEMVGQGFKRALDNIWYVLMEDEVARIGVYGMGGVGKSTVMKHIHKRLEAISKQFPNVYWITVSQDCDITRLQNLIAKKIDLDISDERDNMHRAAKLAKKLQYKGSFVLIIDDLWQYFDLEEVGLPQGGYKLMFTTGSLEVCRQMNCQEENIIKVESLSPEEAWELFVREHGAYDIEVERYAKEIVRECNGLPLAIKTVGRSMRGVVNEVVWRNAVNKIKDPTMEKSEMDPVFRILRFSYSCLDDEISLQQCFLYCALFPEDYMIEREELINFLIDEGIIGRKKCRFEEVDEGLVMLNKLMDLCLLEEDASLGKVKMHDLIRDMALKILSEESSVMVQAGKELTECPDAEEWMQSHVRVSLMKNKIREIGCDDWRPICPNLSTLLLSENYNLEMISDNFFERLDGLKVLDLSYTGIQRLPKSISNLMRLSALLLQGCYELEHIPSLAKLIALEKLDLKECYNIEEVPLGMEFLHKLRYLDLTNWIKLKEFPAGILPKLSLLQVLRIDRTLRLKGEEVGCLKILEDLSCCFPNLAELNKYLRFAKPLHKFEIDVNPIDNWDYDEFFDDLQTGHLNILSSDLRMGGDFRKLPEWIEYLRFSDCKFEAGRLSDLACVLNGADGLKKIELHCCEGVEWIASVAESSSSLNVLEHLEELVLESTKSFQGLIQLEDEVPPNLSSLYGNAFVHLKKIEIFECDGMKRLFPQGLLPNLKNLESIHVNSCSRMKEIIGSEEREEKIEFSLPKLKHLHLFRLPRLESICSSQLNCESLEEIELFGCRRLKRIPIAPRLPYFDRMNIHSEDREWWEQLDWDRSDVKTILDSQLSIETSFGIEESEEVSDSEMHSFGIEESKEVSDSEMHRKEPEILQETIISIGEKDCKRASTDLGSGEVDALPKEDKELEFLYKNFGASDFPVLDNASKVKSITILSCDGIESLASLCRWPADVFSSLKFLQISYTNSLHHLVSEPSSETFACLKSIEIKYCDNLKKLFPRGLLPNLQNLEKIEVEECLGVKEIMASEESSTNDTSGPVTLPKLRELILIRLPLLESISREILICESLELTQLQECPMLKKVSICLAPPSQVPNRGLGGTGGGAGPSR